MKLFCCGKPSVEKKEIIDAQIVLSTANQVLKLLSLLTNSWQVNFHYSLIGTTECSSANARSKKMRSFTHFPSGNQQGPIKSIWLVREVWTLPLNKRDIQLTLDLGSNCKCNSQSPMITMIAEFQTFCTHKAEGNSFFQSRSKNRERLMNFFGHTAYVIRT